MGAIHTTAAPPRPWYCEAADELAPAGELDVLLRPAPFRGRAELIADNSATGRPKDALDPALLAEAARR